MLDEKKYIGNIIEITCLPVKLLYPNKDLYSINGEFGVLSVDTVDVISGEIPEIYNVGWGKEKLYRFVICGVIPLIENGRYYYAKIQIEEDEKYKYRFKAIDIHEQLTLNSPEAKRNFLYSILGDYNAELLYNGLTDPTIQLEREDINTLVKIKGIGPKLAQKLINIYKKEINHIKLHLVLRDKYGLTTKNINKLMNIYGSLDVLVTNLEDNPYVLLECDGFGWKKTDNIALNSGIKKDNPRRIAAYIKYYLKTEVDDNGNTWIILSDLVKNIRENLFNINSETLVQLLKCWTGRDGTLNPWLYYEETTKKIGLMSEYKLEVKIKNELLRIQNAPVFNYNKEAFDIILADCEKENGWSYTAEQVTAIKQCLDNNITIITGGAGCGKTSVMKPLTRFLRAHGFTFAQCALSGKASSNLSEITNEPGQTIHRLLGYNPDNNEFICNASNPIITNMIILDEASMIDNYIFYSLLRAIPNGCKLIMLGDTNQLDPIGSGNILKDLIDSHKIPYCKFTKIMRQAAKSGIITESLKVSQGVQIVDKLPKTNICGELQDLKIKTYIDSENSASYFITEYMNLLNQGVDFRDIMGVVPMKTRGRISCFELNNKIQSIVNNDLNKKSITIKNNEGYSYIIRVGDKVVNRRNRYDTLKVIDGEITDQKEPIFNGNVGYVKSIEQDNIIVTFTQQGDIYIPHDYIQTVMLGYVLTCNSAQGSQAAYVIVSLDMSAYMLLSKEWLYTAMTRAKKYCILAGENKAIRIATNISKIANKQTWLKQLLTE